MKKVTILMVAVLLCGMTFAAEKNLQEIDQRIAPPSFSPLDGTWCSQPNVAIPDSDGGAAVDVLSIPDAETIANLDVSLQIVHTWTGDLRAELTNGNCTIQLLHRIGLDGDTCCGCSGDDFDVVLDDDGASSIEASCGSGGSGGAAGSFTPGDPLGNGLWPTAMADCNGESTAGDWTLTVTDGAGGDTGVVLEWCVTNTGGGGTGDGGGAVPATGTTGLIILAVLLMIGGSLFVLQRRRA